MSSSSSAAATTTTTAAAAASAAPTTAATAAAVVTIPIDQVHAFEFSRGCLQSSPCQHTVTFVVNKRRYQVDYVSGDEIARFLNVKKSRKGAHFNYIFDRGWAKDMQAKHMNKEPIQVGRSGKPDSFVFTYPEGYKPTEMKPIKLPPPRPSKKDKEYEAAREYLDRYGVTWCQPVTLREAKAIVQRLRGLYRNI